VTKTEGVYYNIDYRIRLIDETLDFITGSENYSSFIGRFLLESGFNSVREICISLIYLKYRQGTSVLVRSIK
jgi:hypothetical protein